MLKPKKIMGNNNLYWDGTAWTSEGRLYQFGELPMVVEDSLLDNELGQLVYTDSYGTITARVVDVE